MITAPRTRYAGDPLLPAADLAHWLRARPEPTAQVARATGLSRRHLYCYRSGQYRHVTLGVADRIVTALGGRVDDVWGDLDEHISACSPVAARRRPSAGHRARRRSVIA